MLSYIVDPLGNYEFCKPVSSDQIVTLAISILKSSLNRGDSLSNPKDAAKYIQLQLGGLEQEVFSASFLDNGHRVIKFEKLFYGTIDGASVYPREVAKKALHYNAAAIIFAHNHPSGVAEPSKADESLTRRFKDALALIDVRVIDHLVVSQEGYVSMSERGLI